MAFHSPTEGSLGFEEMLGSIFRFIGEAPDMQYKIIVGTDSQTHDRSCFVSAVIIHRLGHGARYYYRKHYQRKINNLRQKIFYETSLSLSVAGRISDYLAERGNQDLDLEVHVDVGRQGETRNLIREVVGMVVGSGFEACVKPDSYGASKVADRHTK